MWVQEKILPKYELPKSIPLHVQELNYGINICELEDHVEEEGLSLSWPSKLQLIK
jgi:hypothetical protein